MNQEFPFIGGAYTARSKDLNSQVCQNLYVEVDQTGAKNIISLTGVPGMKVWKNIGYAGEVRGFKVFGDSLYAVIKDRVYKIESNLTATNIGTIGTESGWVDLQVDDSYLVIFDSTGAWYCDGATLTAVTLPVTPSSATYQDGYHIISQENSDAFFISSLDANGLSDITTWDATQFSYAEGDSDNLVRVVSVQRQLWLIGKLTSEIWYKSDSDFPFDRNPGGFIRIGCNAKRSVATWEDDLLFLDDKNRIVRKNGLQLEPVSTYQIDYLISTFTTVSDAVGFIYSQEGHVFYELSFPSENKTICYDLTTGFWHTRASTAQNRRSYANCVVRFNNKVLVGDFENGKIYEYDYGTYTDDGQDKVAIRACQFATNNNMTVFHNSFELDMETGVGNSSVTTPQAMLQFSDDGGHTWSTERWKSIGAIGEYGLRVKWWRLGKSRNRIYRVTISDAVKRNINKAYLDIVQGNG